MKFDFHKNKIDEKLVIRKKTILKCFLDNTKFLNNKF